MSAPVDYDWDAAHEALESLDDFARMDVGVAPHGPYAVLRDLITKAKGWRDALSAYDEAFGNRGTYKNTDPRHLALVARGRIALGRCTGGSQ